MIGLIASFICGAVVTLLLVILGAAAWIYYQPVLPARTKELGPYVQPRLSKRLQEVYAHVNGCDDGSAEVNIESCNWLNVIGDFLFRELRDSTEVKRFVMRKINKEFAEVMMTKPEGRMIEQLTVREYSFGTSLPVLTSASIGRLQCCEEDENEPMEIDIILDFVYDGGLHLAIDADLVFNKAAYVAVDVLRAKGRGRLQFSRQPFTHWSFALCEDPEFELEIRVDSQFEGRNLPQLSSFIESQIRKLIRRKHTLPSCKRRFKPFFRKCKPHNQLLDVFVHNHKVTVGQLQVRVVHCTRLTPMEGATKMYCSLGVACTPWQPMVRLWRTQWPVHEISVRRGGQTIGIKYRMVVYVEDEVRHDLVLVSRVYSESAASRSGIKVGDILIRVNNVKVTSVRQVNRLIEKSKGDSVLITVQRPPSQFTLTLLNSGTAPPHTSSSSPLPSHPPPHNTSPPPSDMTPHIPPPQHESEKLVTDRETGGATVSTVLDTQAESVRKRKTGRRGLETKGFLSASQSPLDSFDGSGFSAQYGSTLLPMSPPLGDYYTFSASEGYSTTPTSHPHLHSHPPTPRHRSHRRHKRPAEDSISLCGVTGEREVGVSSGLGATEGDGHPELTKADLLRPTLSVDESTGARGAEATTQQHPEGESSSHSGTELRRHSSSPHTPTPPPPPAAPPPPPLPAPTATRRSEDTTDVGAGAVPGREHDTSTHVHTTEVSSCKHPQWNECFTFEVGEEDHYLNVCVWNKLSEGRGDLLIGHVTIPLMDIALECISTSSGTHHQQYVLTASQPAKAGTSRTVLQATSSSTFSSSTNKKINKEEFPFVGDIFLQFQHSPAMHGNSYDDQFHTGSCNDQDDDDSSDKDEEPCDKQVKAHHPFTATRGQMPSDHYFTPVDVEGAQQCDICHKRIWGFHVQECQNCQLKCHKKCSQYCKKEVPCYRHSSRHRLIHQREGGNSGDDEDSELENEHRHLEQSLVDTLTEASGRISEQSILLRDNGGHPNSENKDMKVEECDYQQQSHDHSEANSGGSDSDQAVTADSGSENEAMEQKRALEEFSYNLYSHLPPAEREAALNQKISELQYGIDHINECINDTAVMLRNPNISPLEAEQINNQMADYESKLEPLKLLMMQHMFALDQCSAHNE